MSAFNSGEFRRFVEDKTNGGTLFGKNKISKERELSLMKQYLQSLLDDPDNYRTTRTELTEEQKKEIQRIQGIALDNLGVD